MSGWYKQTRGWSERPWFKDACMVQLYAYLKDVAYVADGKYRGRVIRRGSCPTTRAEMMEATGLSYKKLDKCLRGLQAYNEIIVRGDNQFTIVTICDYDSSPLQNDLFDAYSVQQRYNEGYSKGITEGTTEGTASPILLKEERREEDKILISPYSPYKPMRESREAIVEIKKRYNKLFDGLLQPCIRLTMPTQLMVEECIRLFGKQAVDLVFDQVKEEPFSMGQNKTGFRASFQFIFQPRNFQQYLERAQLRLRKRQTQPEKSMGTLSVEHQPTKEQLRQQQLDQRRRTLAGLVEMAEKNPENTTSAWYDLLIDAYQSGQLRQLGINWQPKQKSNET